MIAESRLQRLRDELAQIWTVAVKDIRIYYLQPPMIMFGLILPFFLFFSFSFRRNIGVDAGMAQLLAMTTFFTASSAGPVVLPLERRMGTYDRLLAAPMSLISLLVGQTLVGAFFGIVASMAPLLVGVIVLQVDTANAVLLLAGVILASLAFSAFGLVFGSIPTQSVGSIMMPSTLIRWPLLFISGIFVPLSELAPWARGLAHLSPLTYAHDIFRHAILGAGYINLWLDLGLLLALMAAFLIPAARMHHRNRL
jgi:ABC-2 type transport system permease protein